MATLVLTTVGTLVGGPIGGAVGALLGHRIDGALLGGGGRQGPRMGELAVQTSAYGTQIPKLFGRMRVAGTVIWATDLIETGTRSGGGKGRPSTTQYSYAASFAVALSARRLLSIGRIWADGILLRGAAGDWKGVTGFRFHDGREGQAADPLIAAVEGADAAPAYRGLSYVVFEQLQLAPYGNRIPSLSFEVVADDAPVTVGAIAAVLSDGAVADATRTTVAGYAASGDSTRGAIETLARAVPVTLADDGDRLVLHEGGDGAVLLDADGIGAAAGPRGGVRHAIDRRAAGTVTATATLGYYEIARDYQAGVQRACHGGPGRRTDAIELPAALSADAARAIVEARLAADWAARREAVVRLPWRAMRMRAGRAVRLPGSADAWRVAAVTLDRMVIELRLVGDAVPGVAVPPAMAGRATVQPDTPHGPSRIALFELPAMDDRPATVATLYAAAAGSLPGWRQAQLEASPDDGATLIPIGRTAPAAVLGRVAAATRSASALLFDERTVIDVVLDNAAMVLEGRMDAALLAGANLALIGEELIQFGRAEQTGIARFRIGRLLRGRWGTEAAIDAHRPDERFVLIEPDRLTAIRHDAAAVGSAMTVIARGIGDPVPVTMRRTVTGLALRPYAPVHLHAARDADGAILLRWIRRSRTGGAWRDGVDVPLGEEAERYRVTIHDRHGAVRTVETGMPAWRYAPEQQAIDGLGDAPQLTFSVAQMGTAAVSTARTATVPLPGRTGEGMR